MCFLLAQLRDKIARFVAVSIEKMKNIDATQSAKIVGSHKRPDKTVESLIIFGDNNEVEFLSINSCGHKETSYGEMCNSSAMPMQ